jgi:hypothetical protein
MAVSKHFVSNLRCVVCKEEVTPGTAVALTDADFNTRVYGAEVTFDLPIDDEASKFGTGDHGEDEAITGAQSGTIKISSKVSWGGAVATVPAWWKWLVGCGQVQKAYTTTGIAAQPKVAGDDKTLTIWVIDIIRGASPTGMAYKFAGCMGDGSIGCDGIGKPWKIEGTFKGKLVDIAAITAGADMYTLTSPDTSLPETLCNNAVTINSKTKKISSFKLSFGNDVQPQYNQADSTCIDFFGIVNRKPRLQMNPLMTTISGDTDSSDPLADFLAMTTSTGSIVGVHHTLNLPKVQLLTMAQAAREGLVGWDMNYKLLRNASADAALDAEVTWELLQGARA